MILKVWYQATRAEKLQTEDVIIQCYVHLKMNQSEHYFFDLHNSVFNC